MKKNWESPDCAICRTNKYLSVLWNGVTTWEHPGRFNFVKCLKCGLVFQSPRALFKDAVIYYPSESYWGRDVRNFKKVNGWKKERERAYHHLYKGIFMRKKKGVMLDIGSGLGLFLSKFKDLGWKVIGTDISSDIGKYSKKIFDITVQIGDFVKLNLPYKEFDLITMNGVFEHIYNPRETLIKAKKILNKDGLLVIEVPNIESLGYLIHRKNWYHLQPGRHIYQFSPKTLNRLLVDCGFKIEEINHSFWAHNYYSLFENIRFRTSSRFRKNFTGGLEQGSLNDLKKPSKIAFIKEIGKLSATVLATIGSIIEPLIKRGEVITVYAKKD